jgi:hypothetical protein
MNKRKILLGCLVVLALLTIACNDLGGGNTGRGRDGSEQIPNPITDGQASEDPGLGQQHDELYDITMGLGEHSKEKQ